MVNGCDGEVKTYAHSPSRSLRNSPCVSPVRTLSSNNPVSSSNGSSLLRRKSLDQNNETTTATSSNGSVTSLHQNGDAMSEMAVDDDNPVNCACPGAEEVNNDSEMKEQCHEMMDTSDGHQASSSSSSSGQHVSTSSAVSVITNFSKGTYVRFFICFVYYCKLVNERAVCCLTKVLVIKSD